MHLPLPEENSYEWFKYTEDLLEPLVWGVTDVIISKILGDNIQMMFL